MRVAIPCPACEKAIGLPEGAAGKRVKCAKCGAVNRVVETSPETWELQLLERAPSPMAAAAPAASPASPAPPASPLAAGSTCAACGAVLPPTDQFCTACGAKRPARPPQASSRLSRGRSPAGAGKYERARKVRKAAKWVLIVAIVFAVLGTGVGFYIKDHAAKQMALIATAADTDAIALEDGTVLSAGEYRKNLSHAPARIFVVYYSLAAVMLGLYFWARRSPLPALVTAFSVYLAYVVIEAIIEPLAITNFWWVKLFFFLALGGGIRAAASQRTAARLEAAAEPA